MSVIVERELDYFGPSGKDTGIAQVFTPLPDDRSWSCAYQLQWPGFTYNSRAFGVDAWQALQLAMYIVPTQIFATDDFKGGRIGVFGERATTYESICGMFGVKPVEGPTQ